MEQLATASDFYGTSAPKILKIHSLKTASAASGDPKLDSAGEKTPAFSLIAIITMLVIVRLLWELAD